MRVVLSQDYNQYSGPHIFMRRLIKELEQQSLIQIVNNRADILFSTITLPKKITCKSVLRIDGFYWHGGNVKQRNLPIIDSIKRADGIVFQSQFSRNCADSLKCNIKASTIIYNAIDLNHINNIPPKNIQPGIVATADWRATKRPSSICLGFIESQLDLPLYMVGNCSQKIKHKNIHWLNNVCPTEVISILKANKYAVHLGAYDNCPNSVIEQLACRLPILYAGCGGVPEIVANNGVSLGILNNWHIGEETKNIDNLDKTLVSNGFKQLINTNFKQIPDFIDIKYCAKQYYNFFLKILE